MANQYVTGAMIKKLREEKKLTQAELGERIFVTDKAISKWETGRGYPDVSLIESLAKALGVSVIELFAGEGVVNTNKSANMAKLKLYVCPVCGNIIQSTGEIVASCCGITLPALEAEPEESECADDSDATGKTVAGHHAKIEHVEDEFYVSIPHEMTREHYISFIAAVRSDGFEIRKLYPEQEAEARFKISGTKEILYYCNRDGLFKAKLPL